MNAWAYAGNEKPGLGGNRAWAFSLRAGDLKIWDRTLAISAPVNSKPGFLNTYMLCGEMKSPGFEAEKAGVLRI